MNFYDDYVKYVSGRIDSPLVFIEASGFHLLSATLSRYFQYAYIQHKTKPNTMFVLSSIPGRTRRSTLASIDRSVYSLVYQEIVKPMDAKTDKKKLVYDSIIEEGSPEGILDGIGDYVKKVYGPYNIDYQSTEFGDVMKTMSGKNASYHRGVARIISKTYYGEGTKINLSKHGGKSRFLEEGVYSTMFGGMQKANLYIDPYHVEQGLLRRIILVTPKDYRYKPFLDPFRERDRDMSGFSDQIKAIHDKITPIFKRLGEEIPVVPLPNVEAKLNEIDEQRATAVAKDDSYENLIKQSDSEHLLKLATLLAINECNISGDRLHVNIKHYEKAKDFFDRATGGNEEFYTNIGVVSRPAFTDSSSFNRILKYIPHLPGSVTKTYLYKYANIKKEDLEPILEALILSGKVKELPGRSKKYGKS